MNCGHFVLYCYHDQFWKIADFGLASEGTSKKAQTTRYARGTSSYRAPELIREEKYTNKVDIWAVGCIFYEVLFKEKAFSNDYAISQFAQDNHPSERPLKLPFEKAMLHYEISNDIEKGISELLYATIRIDPSCRPAANDIRGTISEFRKMEAPSEPTFECREELQQGHETESSDSVSSPGTLPGLTSNFANITRNT